MLNKYKKIVTFGFVLLFLIPSLALGRAGGWHGGSSSSHSSSSSFGSSSSSFGGSNMFSFASWLSVFSSSWVWFFLFIFFIIWLKSVIWYNVPNLSSERDNSYLDAMENINADIQTITSIDPLWNEQKFKELVNTAFFKIQNAWCAGDMSWARAFISDGILKRFTLQLEPYKAKWQRNVLGQLSLDSASITDIRTDEKYAYITTIVTATCTDTTVDSEGKIVESNYGGELTTWSEKWVWMRSNTVKTSENEKWVFVDKCPNCGAVLKINAIGKCDYCGTELTKWDFDWVLSEIDQM